MTSTTYGVYKGVETGILCYGPPSPRYAKPGTFFLFDKKDDVKRLMMRDPMRKIEYSYIVHKARSRWGLQPSPIQGILIRFKQRLLLHQRLPRLVHRARLARMKEELVAAAWHPKRVAVWLEAGVELEDL